MSRLRWQLPHSGERRRTVLRTRSDKKLGRWAESNMFHSHPSGQVDVFWARFAKQIRLEELKYFVPLRPFRRCYLPAPPPRAVLLESWTPRRSLPHYRLAEGWHPPWQ